ncbi:MAG: cysteine--tRNA ligase [Planctomycetota bacterium]|nr:MAG: cysteine--tRNA ligase [Planctomycetota bacterium]
MGITVYNTLTRKKEPLEPVHPGKIGIYLCGPTVYKPSHIGHAVGPIIFDAIKRYLVHRGYDVTWVVNITDVDDKLIDEARKQNTSTFELAERVTRDYLDAMSRLHVDGIDIMPKASEHIGDILRTVQRLIDKGVAYVSGGDVYFDVTKHDGYGKLSNRRIEEQEGRRALQSGEKRNPADFALWKAAKPDEPDEVKFDSPWGKGRPGWHIECSAMSQRYLGETFDIHGGGMDLIFPHHENEIAQSEAATGKPFARVWMHNGLTRVNTKKISKSDASPEMQEALMKMTLHNLLETYPPELIRFFVLSTHYRRPIEYSEDELESKRKGLETFYRLFERIERITGRSPYADQEGDGMARSLAAIRSESLAAACREADEAFHQAMDDDFNTAGAIAALFELAGRINRFIEEHDLDGAGDAASAQQHRDDAYHASRGLIELGRLLGLFIDPPLRNTTAEDGLTDQVMQILIDVRGHARKKKDFETADMIRDRLAQMGITLEDLPDGTVWRRNP